MGGAARGGQLQHHRAIPPAHPPDQSEDAAAGLSPAAAREPAAQPQLRLAALRPETAGPLHRRGPFPDDARRSLRHAERRHHRGTVEGDLRAEAVIRTTADKTAKAPRRQGDARFEAPAAIVPPLGSMPRAPQPNPNALLASWRPGG